MTADHFPKVAFGLSSVVCHDMLLHVLNVGMQHTGLHGNGVGT
jgi:hypothetical protein